MALNGLFCADVPLRYYSLTHSLLFRVIRLIQTARIVFRCFATEPWTWVAAKNLGAHISRLGQISARSFHRCVGGSPPWNSVRVNFFVGHSKGVKNGQETRICLGVNFGGILTFTPNFFIAKVAPPDKESMWEVTLKSDDRCWRIRNKESALWGHQLLNGIPQGGAAGICFF